VNTVLVVPTRARKYRKALYIFDFLLTWLGLTLLCLSIVMLSYSDETFFPAWLFTSLLIVSLIVLVVGGLGGRGAVVSFRKLEEGTQNWWLNSLTVLVGALLLVEFGMLIWLVIEYGALQSDAVSNKTDVLSTVFENSLKEELQQQTELWWDWQKTFECCGYDNNTIPSPLATGKYCTTDHGTSATECKTVLWADIEGEALPLILFLIAFLAMQIVVCVASMCLACIIKAQEPIYRDN
jgi:hypothetical protein